MKMVEGTRHGLIDTKSLESTEEGKVIRFASPSEIKFVPRLDFDVGAVDEKVADGDWDLAPIPFEDYFVYRSFRDVFVNGKTWRDTELWNTYQAGVERVAGSRDLTEDQTLVWKKLRCRYLTYLYRTMKQFGYQQDPYDGLVSLLIGRNGEVILNNGRHRVAVAKLLGCTSMPVLIDVRHRDWWNLKQSIIAYAKEHGGMVYAPLLHLDLQDIPIRQEGRIEDVRASIHNGAHTIADLGANWGYFSAVLSNEGFDCTAVESDDVEFKFLDQMKRIYGGSYKILMEDACDFIIREPRHDVILALSLFHHLARTKIGHSRLEKLLRTIDCNVMIFQMPCAEEMKIIPDCHRNYNDKEWMQFIINNSCLSKFREIGNRTTRKMYCLEK
jgi:hypothetical protein